MRAETSEWVEKTEGDFGTANRGSAADHPNFDAICFHAQQCAEKYLKAMLQERMIRFAKTHDLEVLLNALAPEVPERDALVPAAQSLSDYAVEFRYPGCWAGAETARRALEHCRAIRAECGAGSACRSANHEHGRLRPFSRPAGARDVSATPKLWQFHAPLSTGAIGCFSWPWRCVSRLCLRPRVVGGTSLRYEVSSSACLLTFLAGA